MAILLLSEEPDAPVHYNIKALPFMQRQGPQQHITESYVSCPPALVIQDADGDLWTLGFDMGGWRTGEFEYDVVRNGRMTGEYACRLEYRGGKLRIFGQERWRVWDRNRKCFV